MANTILIKKSSTANAVPLTGDLAFGELAINVTDGNLFYKNSATGNVTVIASNKFSSVSGNVTGGNVLTAGQVSATGNVTGNYILGNISQATGYNSNTIYNGTSNVSVATVNGNVTISVGGTSNVAVFSTAGVSLPGNVVAGNLLTDNIYYANGTPWDMQQPSGANGQIQYNNNGNFGASANLAFDVANGVFSTANVTATGTVSATGTVTGGNLATGGTVSATGNATFGNISTSGSGGNITGANVSASIQLTALRGVLTSGLTVGNITMAGSMTAQTTSNISAGNVNATNTVSASNLSGTLRTASQPNVTFVGNLITANVTGNLIAGNISSGIGQFNNLSVDTIPTSKSVTNKSYVTATVVGFAIGLGS